MYLFLCVVVGVFDVYKYRNACITEGFDFLPIIFESSGYIAQPFITHLTGLVKRAADVKRIPGDTLKAYCLKRLSFRLQYCFASNIIKRVHELIHMATIHCIMIY